MNDKRSSRNLEKYCKVCTFVMLGWVKKVEAAKWESNRPADKTEAHHSDRMNELEKERYSLIKSIDELELLQEQLIEGFKASEQRLTHIKSQLNIVDSPMMTQEQ